METLSTQKKESGLNGVPHICQAMMVMFCVLIGKENGLNKKRCILPKKTEYT